MSDDFEISGGSEDDYDFAQVSSPRTSRQISSAPGKPAAPISIAAKPVKSFFALGGGGGSVSNGGGAFGQRGEVKSFGAASKTAGGDVYDFELTETISRSNNKSSSVRSSSSSSAYNAPSSSSSSSSSLAKKAQSSDPSAAPMSAMEKAQSMLSRYGAASAVPPAPRQNKKTARFDEDDISIDSPRDSEEADDFEVSQSQSAEDIVIASKPAAALKPPLVAFGQKPPPPTEKPPQALRQAPMPLPASLRVESLGTVRGMHELAELGESGGSADSDGGSAPASGSLRRPGQDVYRDVEDDDDDEEEEDEENEEGDDDDDEDEEEEEEEEDEREADVSAYYMVDRSHFSQLEEEDDEEVEDEGNERAAQGQVMSFADLAAVTGWGGEEDGAAGAGGMESSQASVRSHQSSHSRSEGNLVFSLADPRASPKAAAAGAAAATSSTSAAAAAASTFSSSGGSSERLPPPLHYSAEPAQPVPPHQHPQYPQHLQHPQYPQYPYPYPQPFPTDPSTTQLPHSYPYAYPPPPPYYSYPPPMPFMPPAGSAAPFAQQQQQYPYPYPHPYGYPQPSAPSTYASQESTLAAALREGLLLGGGMARMGLSGGSLHASQTSFRAPGAASSVDLGAGLTGLRPQSMLQERESVVFELLKELRQAKEEAAWARERIAQLTAQGPAAAHPRSPVGHATHSAHQRATTPRRRADDDEEDNEYSADFDESADSSPSPGPSSHSVQFAVRETRDEKKASGQPQQPPPQPQQQQSRQQSTGLSAGSMIDMQSTLLTSQTLFRKQLENLRARLEASAAASVHPEMGSLRAALPPEPLDTRPLGAPSLVDLKSQFEQRRLEQAAKFQTMLMQIV